MQKFMLVPILIFSISFLISCDDDKKHHDGDDALPVISVQSDLEFGDIGANVPVTLTLEITNNLNDNLTGFVATVTDNASGTFTIAADQFADKCTDVLYGNMTCTLRVRALSNVASTYDGDLIIAVPNYYSKEIDLEANVMQGATLNVRTSRLYNRTKLGVGRSFVDAYSVTIENNGTDNLTEPLVISLTGNAVATYNITNLGDGCSGKILTKAGEVGSTCLIEYSVTPQFGGWNNVVISATSGTVTDSARLTTYGTYEASVALLKSTIDFGDVEQGVIGGVVLPISIFNVGYTQVNDFNWNTLSSSDNFFVEYTLASNGEVCTNILGTDEMLNANCSLYINFTSETAALGAHTAMINLSFLGRTYTVRLIANVTEAVPTP